MPRLKFDPTEENRRLVKSLAAVGIPPDQVARKLGIRSVLTLRKHFPDEIDLSPIDANANVAGALYQNAMGGDVNAQKFWLDRRAGWKVAPSSSTPSAPPPFIVALEKKI